ncbi:MAG: ribosome-binding factor A [Candidatus Omnitrophica bacterium]|nr:ribosome-binding factor A [Candidatus Omnitrophota bacterium]
MTKRVEQINELVKRELSQIILREFASPENTLITIMNVDTALNFQSAKIQISVIPESRADAVMKDLNQEIYSIQQTLNKRLKIRPVPKIIFLKM